MSPHSVPDGDAKANGVRRAVIDNGRCPVPPEMDFLGVQGHQLFIEVRDVGPLALYKGAASMFYSLQALHITVKIR